MTRLILLSLFLLISGCASTIQPHSEPVSEALPPPPDAKVWETFKRNLPDSNPDTSWFKLLNTGKDTLIDRLALIDSAKTSIDAQYFLWLEDGVGSLLFERLLAAADRGVRIRLLLDDSFLSGEDNTVLTLSAHPNIELRVYNPFAIRSDSLTARYAENLNDFSRINHRMHNKLLLIDRTAGIVGGRNIADEYFGFGEKLNLRDFDLLTAGAIMPELSNAFDLFWNSDWALPAAEVEQRLAVIEKLAALKLELRERAAKLDPWQQQYQTFNRSWSGFWKEQASAMIPGQAELVMDLPRFDQAQPAQLARKLQAELLSTKREVVIVSAYLIMPHEILESTRTMTTRGVNISFLTNSLATNNHIPAHTAYRRHRREILETGANLYVMRENPSSRIVHEAPGFRAKRFGLHGKVAMFDYDRVFVGTFNLDPRSAFLNTEIGLLITSPHLNEAIRSAFLPDFAPESAWKLKLDENKKIRWIAGDEVLTRQPAGPFYRRILDFFMGQYNADEEL